MLKLTQIVHINKLDENLLHLENEWSSLCLFETIGTKKIKASQN